jgi:hypothetical protein
MKQLAAFFSKYKVILTGLAGAIILAIVNVQDSPTLSFSSFVMPAVLAATSFVGQQLRGQWSSIAGIFFSVLIGFIQSKLNHQPFHFDANGFKTIMAQLAILYFGYTAPPAKSASYEKDPAIEKAKSS